MTKMSEILYKAGIVVVDLATSAIKKDRYVLHFFMSTKTTASLITKE